MKIHQTERITLNDEEITLMSLVTLIMSQHSVIAHSTVPAH